MNKIKQLVVENKIFKDKLEWWESILDFIFYNKVSIGLRHFGRFLKRLPKWIRIAWNQEDWDIGYLYDLIEIKLKEFQKAQEEDTWHVPEETKRRAKQIKICLARLDRYRNWPNYYDYPLEDIVHVAHEDPVYGTLFTLEHTNEENEKQRLGAHEFEQKNYDKFWKDFLQWHHGWWT